MRAIEWQADVIALVNNYTYGQWEDVRRSLYSMDGMSSYILRYFASAFY